jgi:hypothetical protein
MREIYQMEKRTATVVKIKINSNKIYKTKKLKINLGIYYYAVNIRKE